uniref:Uncharacterized protein n=1 Tax=viral metagenome TaxID=1070528 RepID=A0A6C0L1B8_9ZZZZ|tara:strand:- start:32914 stop:33147 length:234 start_codon:yes stop_codon:yes gene_type:complete
MDYLKNTYVIYTKTGKIAKILDIHYDDKTPYYTINILDENREIQTIKSYLKKISSRKKTRKRTKKRVWTKKRCKKFN